MVAQKILHSFSVQVKVLLGHRVVQVACGSRDAQTLALTDEGTAIVLLYPSSLLQEWSL